MATYSENLPGLGLFDDKFKSTVNAPTGSPRDLVGCGSLDYVEAGFAANYNYRVGCGKINPLAGYSFRTIFANPGSQIDATIPQAILLALQEYQFGAVTSAILDLDGQGTDTTLINPYLSAPVNQSFGGAGNYVLKGSSWTKTTDVATTTFTVPRVELIRSCGKTVGFKLGSSMNVLQYDQAECIPVQIGSMSLSQTYYFFDKVTGAQLGYINSGDFDSNFGAALANPQALLTYMGGKQKASIAQTLAVAWQALGFANGLYAVGDFS